MRSITINVPSLLLGILLTALVAWQVPIRGDFESIDGSVLTIWHPLRLEYVPDPNGIVNLVEGEPYTVPGSKTLVITDWGVRFSGTTTDVSISVDGATIWGARSVDQSNGATHGDSAQSLGSGLCVEGGQTVTIAASDQTGLPATMFAAGHEADPSASTAAWGAPLRIPYVPPAEDLVWIDETGPFVVPSGRNLILTDWTVAPGTGFGSGFESGASIQINGAAVWGAACGWANAEGHGVTSRSLKSGIRAVSGDVVSVDAGADPTMFVSGYLVEASL